MEPWREELYHHGILGQKWGKQNGPPYPLGQGKHSAAEKKKNPGLGQMIKDRKRKKARAKALEKARAQKAKNAAERKKQAASQAAKDKVMSGRSDKASEVLKYKDEMTTEQLQNAINRIEKVKTLKAMSAKEVKTGFDKADEVFEKIGKLTNYAEKTAKAYNIAAKYVNAFADAGLPMIGGDSNNNSGKKKKKNNENNSENSNNNQLTDKIRKETLKQQKIATREKQYEFDEKKRKDKEARRKK